MTHLEERSLERCGFLITPQECKTIQAMVRHKNRLVTLDEVKDNHSSTDYFSKVGIYYVWLKGRHIKCLVDDKGFLKTFLYTDQRIKEILDNLNITILQKQISLENRYVIKKIVENCHSKKTDLYKTLSYLQDIIQGLPKGYPGINLREVRSEIKSLCPEIGQNEKISWRKYLKNNGRKKYERRC